MDLPLPHPAPHAEQQSGGTGRGGLTLLVDVSPDGARRKCVSCFFCERTSESPRCATPGERVRTMSSAPAESTGRPRKVPALCSSPPPRRHHREWSRESVSVRSSPSRKLDVRRKVVGTILGNRLDVAALDDRRIGREKPGRPRYRRARVPDESGRPYRRFRGIVCRCHRARWGSYDGRAFTVSTDTPTISPHTTIARSAITACRPWLVFPT